MSIPQLAALLDMNSAPAILDEIKKTFSMADWDESLPLVDRAFGDTIRLFNGEYPGYRACNTGFHDLAHTTAIALAMTRLLHGASLDGVDVQPRQAALGVIAALFHDAGYIQGEDDVDGTGAKYTAAHVQRSRDFATAYLAERRFSQRDIEACNLAIDATDIMSKLSTLKFPDPAAKFLAKALAAADLIGQMSDRIYLEKLTLLYREFQEARLGGFESELDLLRKTASFYATIKNRLSGDLDNVHRLSRHHFRVRWGIDKDLYEESIGNHMHYLEKILEENDEDYHNRLKRSTRILPKA